MTGLPHVVLYPQVYSPLIVNNCLQPREYDW